MDNNIRFKLKDIEKFHIPRWNELPDIDLYVDQVITLFDNYLSKYIDNDSQDLESSIITKTMINNYVKHGLMKPPVKKKYGKEQVATLFVIGILKQVYSISDIQNLIRFAIKTTSLDIAYNRFCDFLEESISSIFFGNKTIDNDEKLSHAEYIQKCVVQTFANKLYVQKILLNK